MDNSNTPQNVGPQGAGQNVPLPPQGQYVQGAQSVNTGAGAGQAGQIAQGAPGTPGTSGTPPAGGQPGDKPAEDLSAGKVATSCLLLIPILILSQVGEFLEGVWDLVKWIISLFKNKWFLIGFAVVVIFLILAAIGGGMQSGTTTP